MTKGLEKVAGRPRTARRTLYTLSCDQAASAIDEPLDVLGASFLAVDDNSNIDPRLLNPLNVRPSPETPGKIITTTD